LKALRSYITGPGITPVNPSLTPTEESIWNPRNGFTKQIVELENLPLRLLKIFDLYVNASASASSSLTTESQQILSECLRCMIVYVEDHNGCLEGMLQSGLRNKIIVLLQTEYLLTNEIVKYGLHLLCILCGYTHTFDDIPLGSSPPSAEGSNTTTTTLSSIPLIIGVDEKILYEIFVIIQNILTRSTSIAHSNTAAGMSTVTVTIDEIIVINIGILCQYLLPLCRSSDPMYQVEDFPTSSSLPPPPSSLTHHSLSLPTLSLICRAS
jgi:hypothetical protein